jgi:hypothetical protein
MKLLWGSDSPFYSYVSRHDGALISLRSSYARETACLDALPADALKRVTCSNILDYLQLPEAITW